MVVELHPLYVAGRARPAASGGEVVVLDAFSGQPAARVARAFMAWGLWHFTPRAPS